MNKALDNYWVDPRLNSQRPSPRIGVATGARDVIVHGRATTRVRSGPVSSAYGILLMVVLAMSALCVTATMRARARMDEASLHYQKMNADVEALRNNNAVLASEVIRLRSDPRTIETAARSRLGMLRPDEIVVSVK